MDMQDVLGQEHVKRAMEVAATGGHSMLLVGTLASGKTTLARRFKTIYDGKVEIEENVTQYGHSPVYLPAIEDKHTLLIATMLPCPCGHFTDCKVECHCMPKEIQHHIYSIPTNLLDKVDMHIEVPHLKQELLRKRRGESSAEIKVRVDHIRNKQPKWKRGKMPMSEDARELAKIASLELGISFAMYDKIIAMSQTIAMMDGKEQIESHHLSEAISYRSLDRNIWG